jgi:DNA-binding response OmpR family regulator
MKLLIIDDEPHIRQMMRLTLERPPMSPSVGTRDRLGEAHLS